MKVRLKSKSHRGITAIAVLLCAAPAAGLNLQYGIGEGRSIAHIAGMVGLVLGAALAGVALERATVWRQRLFSFLCLALFVSVNVTNALGLVASHRAAGQTGAITEIDRAKSLGETKVRVERRLEQLKGEASGRSVAAIQADINTRETSEIFRRSTGCQDVTLAETREWCGELFKLRADLANATDIEKLAARLSAVEAQLRDVRKPVAVDAQAEGLASLLGLSANDAGLLIDVLTAIAIECLAGFGPALVLACMSPARPVTRAKGEKAAEPDIEPMDSLDAFLSGLVPSESWTPNTALMTCYKDVCAETGVTPKSQVAVSNALSNAGFKKRKIGGRVQWALRERHGLQLAANG